MNDLIKIEDRGGIPTVNARELYAELESKQQFSDWIKNRIEKYGFQESIDYMLHKFMKQVPHQGGLRNQDIIEYHVSLDMAKELAMVENNDRGRKVRRYFIAVEKAMREGSYQYLMARMKSKKIRRDFTDELKVHGISKPFEYANITVSMKREAGIDTKKKKDGFDRVELLKTTAAESIASARMITENPNGYGTVKPVCDQSARFAAIAVDDPKKLLREPAHAGAK